MSLAAWLDAPPEDVQTLPDGRGVFTTCRCSARVEATRAEDLRAMLAGHWLFDDDHSAFVRAEEARRG